MLLSLKWLHELTPFEVSAEELAHKLTMLGLEVEEIQNPFLELEPVVVGHVLTCEPHPDADTLSVCNVDLGGDLQPTIVCGAPNVAAGQKVAVAPVGTILPGDLKIKKAKIRGQRSEGMICSESELGLGDGSEGIMVLDPAFAPGTPLIEALDLERTVFDIGITPNRADCLSVLGVAREVAAAYNLPLYIPEGDSSANEGPTALDVDVEIKDGDLCPLYQAMGIEDITLQPSPDWMRYRLLAVGQRPINNIVDITNYVLLEQGQPLHAFDRDRLKGDRIHVAPAEEGQTITTLDGQRRTLQAGDLLIWDAEQPVALAGVMGGANSEMQQGSSRVLLECAVFDPGTIRKTARRLALSSESSYRFERGVDQPGSSRALNRAAALMAEYGHGRIAKGVAKNEPRPWQPRRLSFRPERTKRFLALEVHDGFCRQTLTGLGCVVDTTDPALWHVDVPSYRLDLEREVDLSEEIARVYGMDQIPASLPRVSKSLESDALRDTHFDFLQQLKTWASGLGLNEAVNYSFVGTSDLDCLGLPEADRLCVCNPLSAEQDTMRSALAPGLLQTVRHNCAQGNTTLRLFELAHTFHADPNSETTAKEIPYLGLLLTGRRHEQGWPFPAETLDYTDIKGLVEHLLSWLGQRPTYTLQHDHGYLEPCVRVDVGERTVGTIGRVHDAIAKVYRAKNDVWLAEFDIQVLEAVATEHTIVFSDLPKFPPVHRDMTAIVPPGVTLQTILDTLHAGKEDLLQDMVLVDIYQPEDSAEQKFTLRLTYRHPNKTLKDKEVDTVHTRLGKHLLSQLPVRFS